MKKSVRRVICAILCMAILMAFAGCQIKNPAETPDDTTAADAAAADTGVNIRDKLSALMVSDQKLGVAGRYTTLADVPNGSVDPDLIGTWVSADGEMTYTYSADGVCKASSAAYGDTKAPFTCVTIKGYKIICEEMELSAEYYDGAQEGDTQLSFAAYSVENDVLYQVIVETVNEDYTSSASALVTMYRADASGSGAAAMAKNPISMQSINGTWTSDKGSFTVENGTLQLGEDTFTLSFNEHNDLVAEKDGKSCVYSMNIAVLKDYDYEDRTKFTESVTMGLYYTGADENDKPNLLSVLEDWKTEYEYDSWYYAGNFRLQ